MINYLEMINEGSKVKITDLEEILSIKGNVSKKGSGFIVRKSFFYTFGKTAEDYVDSISKELSSAGIKFQITGYGQVDKPFRGGQSVKQGSHWWVTFEVL